MIIIADSSALVCLATCEALFLLDKLFEKIQVPQFVYQECSAETKPFSDTLAKYLKDKITNVNFQENELIPKSLGRGETEAILLYKQQMADYILIDDNRGRKVASLNNCRIIGSLGILLLAKKKGLIKEITPYYCTLLFF